VEKHGIEKHDPKVEMNNNPTWRIRCHYLSGVADLKPKISQEESCSAHLLLAELSVVLPDTHIRPAQQLQQIDMRPTTTSSNRGRQLHGCGRQAG
jgi:hypothetical protein